MGRVIKLSNRWSRYHLRARGQTSDKTNGLVAEGVKLSSCPITNQPTLPAAKLILCAAVHWCDWRGEERHCENSFTVVCALVAFLHCQTFRDVQKGFHKFECHSNFEEREPIKWWGIQPTHHHQQSTSSSLKWIEISLSDVSVGRDSWLIGINWGLNMILGSQLINWSSSPPPVVSSALSPSYIWEGHH